MSSLREGFRHILMTPASMNDIDPQSWVADVRATLAELPYRPA